MKKLLGFLAIGAIVLGMASCNDENVKLKNFMVSVEKITPESAELTITPNNPNIKFVSYVDCKSTFLKQPQFCRAFLMGLSNPNTDSEKVENWPLSELLPNTEHIVLVSATDGKGGLSGDIEYFVFKTPNVDKIDNPIDEKMDHPMRNLTGTTSKMGIDALHIYATNSNSLSNYDLDLMVYAKDWTGKFTKEDLLCSVFDRPYLRYTFDGGQPDELTIFNTEFTGVEKDELIIYDGWVEVVGMLSGEKGAWRVPFHAECSIKESEPE